jgi:prepilin-type processing-associated H-X9-DG protein
LDIDAMARRLLAGHGDDAVAAVGGATEAVGRRIESLRRSGGKELFVLVSPAAILGPPVAIVPLIEGADAREIGRILCARSVRNNGKTTYLVPRGKATIFPEGDGVKIGEITDGTSNTIPMVDANDDQAVTWTRPGDWDVEPDLKPEGLVGHHPRGTNLLFADGGVRFLTTKVAPSTFLKLFTRNGGEVIGADEF